MAPPAIMRQIAGPRAEEGMMTSIGMTAVPGHAPTQRATSGPVIRKVLLACGILSSLIYLVADVLGGMRYPGYSFSAQAISELMATGSPSERLVDPLFLLYGALALAFAVGVLREGADRNRALRVTGALLLAYAAIGFSGPTLFEMKPRGAAGSFGDRPHVVLTAALVLLLLLALGFGAFALGKAFRAYSIATLVIVIAFGVLSAPYAALLAAGRATPGFGILERINIYGSLLWIVVLAVALLRRGGPPQARAVP
jgi:hypothetical membrane protein